MKKSLFKDTTREIKKSIGRFFSIFFIIAIGVAFFSGVKVASPSMKNTADNYYDNNNLFDIQVISNLGLTNNDISEIKNVNGVEAVKGTYSKDLLTKINNSELVIRAHSIDLEDIKNNNKEYINKLTITQGRLPEKNNECVIEDSLMYSKVKVGETIKLYGYNNEKLEDSLKTLEYKIVGKVRTPYYISHQKGNSNIGYELNSFIMIPKENFKSEVYTEAYITLKNTKDLLSYEKEYSTAVEKIQNKVGALGDVRAKVRYNEIYDKANLEIINGKNEIKENENKINEKLDKAKKEIENGKIEILNGEKELKHNEEDFKAKISKGKAEILKAEKKLLSNEKTLNEKYNEFNKNKPYIEKQINLAKEELNKGYETLDKHKYNLSLLEEKLTSDNLTDEDREKIESEILLTKNLILNLETKLNKSQTELNSKIKELESGESTFKESFKQISIGKTEIENKKTELASLESETNKKFEKAKIKLEDSKNKILKGEEEYKNSKEKAEKELKDAKRKIQDAEEKLNNVENGKWYVLNREQNYGFVDFGNSAESINAISKIFPVFFFLVAALICLTTMTRMIDEQRVVIGTLKGLGYSKFSIASKYLIYGAIASILGSVVGLLVGFTVFPTVIFNAYASMTYVLPPLDLMFDFKIAIMSTVTAILITTLTALVSCYKELIETPSLLMRPKAPKQGKRILLERISFIWNKMNFIQKVTARNIFRYKKRFLMTVIGISGCSALLLSGFGIKDSISAIISKQYGEVFIYDGYANYKTEVYGNKLDKSKIYNLKDYENVRIKNINIYSENNDTAGNIFVLENTSKISDFVNLKDRSSKKVYNLTDDGVLITEKLAKILNIKVGDKILLEDEDKNKKEALVKGICENYVSHYVYMTPNYYKSLFKKDVLFNQMLIKLNDKSQSFEKNLASSLTEVNNINSVEFNSTTINTFENMISNLNYVVLLMIISAGSLAFVVLYNLTNVNVSERVREIATIKVLGFYDREVSDYVFRENVVLTIIGSIFGLILGVFLHRFIMVTAELEFIMFGRDINLVSYIVSFLLTVLFGVIVNLFMHNKLKNIKMVESLKSID